MGDSQAPAPGRLLVANPLLPDVNFDRTVVLLLAHGDDGAIGIVLNRPSETEIAAPLPRWEGLAAEPAVVFVGGPVQLQAVICLARPAGGTSVPGAPPGWNAVTADMGTLDLDQDPDGIRGDFDELRIFAGYAGWSPGQLEEEIAAGAWWVVDARPGDAFSDDPDGLWRRVLRRQGPPLALVASYPADPMLN